MCLSQKISRLHWGVREYEPEENMARSRPRRLGRAELNLLGVCLRTFKQTMQTESVRRFWIKRKFAIGGTMGEFIKT